MVVFGVDCKYFRESGCENWPFFGLDKDHERVMECTTLNFTGYFSPLLFPVLSFFVFPF